MPVLTVGASTDADALPRVFGTAAHAAVAWPEELAPVVGPLIRSALRSAETRRRIGQRHRQTATPTVNPTDTTPPTPQAGELIRPHQRVVGAAAGIGCYANQERNSVRG